VLETLDRPLTLLEDTAPRAAPPPSWMDERPWGRFQQLVLNEPCSVKIITVEPHQRLSLQSHQLRSEWWIVLDDAMEVHVDGRRVTLRRGEEVFIPQGAVHRAVGLEQPCRWLEIAFGRFDEQDIERYEDAYGRQ
jgi:mannose-6-phosphate isomerase